MHQTWTDSPSTATVCTLAPDGSVHCFTYNKLVKGTWRGAQQQSNTQIKVNASPTEFLKKTCELSPSDGTGCISGFGQIPFSITRWQGASVACLPRAMVKFPGDPVQQAVWCQQQSSRGTLGNIVATVVPVITTVGAGIIAGVVGGAVLSGTAATQVRTTTTRLVGTAATPTPQPRIPAPVTPEVSPDRKTILAVGGIAAAGVLAFLLF